MDAWGLGIYELDGGGGTEAPNLAAQSWWSQAAKDGKILDWRPSRDERLLMDVGGATPHQAKTLMTMIKTHGFANTVQLLGGTLTSDGKIIDRPVGYRGGLGEGSQAKDRAANNAPGGNRYDPATGRFYRPDGSSYTTSVTPGPLRVVSWWYSAQLSTATTNAPSREVIPNAPNNAAPVPNSGLSQPTWFRPSGHGDTVGREGTVVPPGRGIGLFIEEYVPAGHTFGKNHDFFVDVYVNDIGAPDWLVNIPSMPGIYVMSVVQEIWNTPTGILNKLYGTNVPVPWPDEGEP